MNDYVFVDEQGVFCYGENFGDGLRVKTPLNKLSSVQAKRVNDILEEAFGSLPDVPVLDGGRTQEREAGWEAFMATVRLVDPARLESFAGRFRSWRYFKAGASWQARQDEQRIRAHVADVERLTQRVNELQRQLEAAHA